MARYADLFAQLDDRGAQVTNNALNLQAEQGLNPTRADVEDLCATAAGHISFVDTSTKSADTSAVATSSTTSSSAPTTSTPTSTPEPTLAVAPVAGTVTAAAPANAALAKLNTLAVKGREPKTGYAREQFGQAWSDDVNVESGHNGCDTRNDILRRDLTAITVKPGTRGCAVATGTLADPYTGKTIPFTRGSSTSSQVQIDHVVALSDAWQKGAQQLTAEQRRFFANDPRNLQAAHGPTNQKKGDGDAATWPPPSTGYRCTYVSRQIDVKALYKLWVTQAEKDAMTRVLVTCGATPPVVSAAPRPAPTRTSTATPAPAPPTRAYVPPPATTPYTPAPAPAYEPPVQAAPDVDAGIPGDATAICNDGTFSSSQTRRGTCSHHGGGRTMAVTPSAEIENSAPRTCVALSIRPRWARVVERELSPDTSAYQK